MSNIDLDLDALAPSPRKVNFGGQVIEVKPPRMRDLIPLLAVGKKLTDAEGLQPEEAAALETRITATLQAIVPELAGKDLTLPQMLGLLNLIVDMGMPADSKALQERGITPDTAKKVQ